ncbi:MAG: zonular occludens toxin domain-containing protein [Candidatus Electrothrix scaldis]|nr:MAG: zonular occludens toxin domain-containing protein [Candidatus Electrothrix sp. GW3-3]
MIIAFTGTPGSGKTYDAVRKIIENLKMGRVVFTNIDGMNEPECLEMIKMVTGLNDHGLACKLFFFEKEQIEEFWNHVVPGCLIVIDEVQNVFNSRDWQSKKNVAFNAWASVHRHHGYDVVLITQSIMRIDTAVRALVEWTYVYRKINFFGSLVQKKYLCYAYGGEDTGGPPLSKNARTYHNIIFLCYKSYVASDVKELGIMKHANVLKHPIFYAIPLVFGLFLYMLFQSGMIRGDLFGTEKLSKQIANQPKPASKVTKTVTDLNPYSEHTPNIYRTYSATGQTLFTNRITNKNKQPTKKDEQ